MKALRFATIMLTALSLSAAFAHLLEMPAKLNYAGSVWLFLLQTLYPTYGKISGVCEIGAVVASSVLAVLAFRRSDDAALWTVLGALCLLAAHAIFWIWVAPVNAALVPLTPETLPADWTRLRDEWEYAHAARAILQIVALASLVASILAQDRRRKLATGLASEE